MATDSRHPPTGNPDRRFTLSLVLSALAHAIAISLPLLQNVPEMQPTVLEVSLLPGKRADTPPNPLPQTAALPGADPLSPTQGTQPLLAEPAAPVEAPETAAVSQPAITADTLLTPFDGAFQLPEHPGPAHSVNLQYLVAQDHQPASGKARYRYQADAEGNYALGYLDGAPAQAEDPGELEGWATLSRGKAGKEGLEAGAGRRGTPAEETAASLLPGNPAVMQALFQFMFRPPGKPGSTGQLDTGDAAMPQLHYRVADVQRLTLEPLGEVIVLHVLLYAAESTPPLEAWLAVQYRYLPVMLRATDARGRVMVYTSSGFSLE